MKNELVIVRTDTPIPHIYEFVHETMTEETITERALYLPMLHYQEYFNTLWRTRSFTPENRERLQAMLNEQYDVMPYSEFRTRERSAILAGEPDEIAPVLFDEMLDVLPPLAWYTSDGIEYFCCSEFFTGSYTHQYARVKSTGKCYCKYVDYSDRSTWMENILTPEQKAGCQN